MELFFISLIAFIGSALTFFSGFGLGTILLPTFSLFFPLEVSIGLTAIVHFLNNFFKLILVGKHASRYVILRFALPAIPAAILGSYFLFKLSNFTTLFSYKLMNYHFNVEPIKLAISLLMIIFSLFELIPKLKTWTVDSKFLPIGGLLSGFFGGLSGHQGALRSAFLIRSGLSKESFIGTGIVIACLIDLIRLTVYSSHISMTNLTHNFPVLTAATSSAFIGAYVGNQLLKKTTINGIQNLVALTLFVIALLLGMGII